MAIYAASRRRQLAWSCLETPPYQPPMVQTPSSLYIDDSVLSVPAGFFQIIVIVCVEHNVKD